MIYDLHIVFNIEIKHSTISEEYQEFYYLFSNQSRTHRSGTLSPFKHFSKCLSMESNKLAKRELQFKTD